MSETIRKVGKAVKGLLSNKELNEDQVSVIQTKLSDLESQLSSLLRRRHTLESTISSSQTALKLTPSSRSL